MMFLKNVFLILLGVQLSWVHVIAQSTSKLTPEFETVISKIQNSLSTEKVYLHINSNTHLSGETLLFKVYCLDRKNLLSSFSKVAYVELVDNYGRAVTQLKVALTNGLGFGDFFIPSSLETGNYSLIAYTQWMRNWSAQDFFRTEITIVNPFQPTKGLAVDSLQKWDVQFLPEGGTFLVGVPNRLGFRVVNRQGKGAQMGGRIFDDKGNDIAQFNPLVNGLGRVTINPEPEIKYTAVLTDSLGESVSIELPGAQTAGISLQVDHDDLYRVTIRTVGSLPSLGQSLLVAHSHGNILYTKSLDLAPGQISLELEQDLFPTGISVLTIFSSKGEPLGERLIFRKPDPLHQPDILANKRVYGNRERVDLDIRSEQAMPIGHLSISVRQADNWLGRARPSILEYLLFSSELRGTIENPGYYLKDASLMAEEALDNLMLVHGWRTYDDRWENNLADRPNYLPDLRGQVFSGRVLRTPDQVPAPDQLVYLSVPGKEYLFQASRTNSNGEYFFITDAIQNPTEVVLQTVPEISNPMTIEPDNGFLADYQGLGPGPLFLDSSNTGEIINRSVSAQIENAYFQEKGDSTIARGKYERFYRNPDRVYNLDDYTRFILMEEVITELVGSVFIRRSEDGYVLKVKDYQNKYVVFQENPLVLIDGIPLFDINQIIEYDPLLVEKIEVLAQRFLYGPLDCKGIVSFETYDGDADGFRLNPKARKVNYIGIQPGKKYFSPVYDSNAATMSRIPDFRTQLYWDPELALQPEGMASISFYTSDIPGKYTVSIEGILENGQPIATEAFFEVVDNGAQ